MIKIAFMETALQLSGAATTARPDPEPLTVLVVDPSPEGRRTARLSLALAGYAVREAADTTDALGLLRRLTPAAIVTGVSMPGPCDGLGLCAIVRAGPHLRGCAVVVLSGRTDPDRLRRIDEAGASAVVLQPYTAAELVAAVDGVIDPVATPRASAHRPHPCMRLPMTDRVIPE
jgi:CheY-like chemotaxis protein